MSDTPVPPPAKPDDKKTRVITMTLPLPMVEAIENEMADFMMTAGEAIKHWLTVAGTQKDGVTIKLDIKRTGAAAPANQPELPLA